MATIENPANFSSIKKPVYFTVRENTGEYIEVSINGYKRQMQGVDISVNVSNYYMPDIDANPLPLPDSGVIAHSGRSVRRMARSEIIAGGVESDPRYLVSSNVELPQNKILTNLRKRPYVAGQIDELSAVGTNYLRLVLQNNYTTRPMAATPPEEDDPVQYKSFAIKLSATTARYAVLADAAGNILDWVELKRVALCPGVRLCWINRYGVLDYWNFPVLKSKDSAATKTKIYTESGYTTTAVTMEDTTTINTQNLDEDTLSALIDLIASEKAWISNPDGYEEIDIMTNSSNVYSVSSLSALTVQFRPRTRRI